MKLAVISDIHVGLAARAKDLCPEPPAGKRKDRAKYDSKTDNAYRENFVRFVQAQHITAEYLVLPGDVTNRAKPQEVRIASEFVLQAADALTVPRTNILFVPGNHDVDWSVFDPSDTTGVRWGQRYIPVGHEDFHFREILIKV